MSHNQNANRPLVSAIVPAYNASRYIGHTLRSLVTQTYPNMEIVVVDDGSRDATVPLVREMARLHPQIRVIQQPNLGVAAARNCGVEVSRGALIAPVDADDIWFPETAERLAACLLNSERAGVAYSWSVTIDEEGLLDRGFRCSMIEGDVFGTLLCHNFIANASSTMIRRTCFEQVGGYDCHFHEHGAQGCEDWDLYLRIAERCQFRVVPDFLVGYRRSSGSMSSDASSMARSHAHLLRKICQQHPGIPKVLHRLSTSSFYVYLAHECHRRWLPHESYCWLRQALVAGPLFTLLRPGCYTLAVKNALAMFGKPPTSRMPLRALSGKPERCIEDVARRRMRIRSRIMVQDVLHQLVSRLPTC